MIMEEEEDINISKIESAISSNKGDAINVNENIKNDGNNVDCDTITYNRARVFILASDNEWRDLATGNFFQSLDNIDQQVMSYDLFIKCR